MNTAVINIKTQPEVKTKAQEVARELGISLSSLINAFLKQLARTRRMPLHIDEEPNKYLLSVIKKARENRRQEKSSPIFDNVKESLKWLEKQGV